MKTKIVLKGHKTTGENEKQPVFLAIELLLEQNQVITHCFEGDDLLTDDFFEQLQNQWRKNDESFVLPENQSHTVELNATANLILENVELQQNDLSYLERIRNEWVFAVLSFRLFNNYKSELNLLEEKINTQESYDKNLWETMKDFWTKVQTQQNERNLSREHVGKLREQTNKLFDFLKELRTAQDKAFEDSSKTTFDKINAKLQDAIKRIDSENPNFNELFNELKELQKDFKASKLSRDFRTQLWEGIDAAFKAIKEKRAPGSSLVNNLDQRLLRRIEGLKEAILRMEESVERDEKDFNRQKIDKNSTNQLEAQLKEARAKLIRDKINSKMVKLIDMRETLVELEEKAHQLSSKKHDDKKTLQEEEENQEINTEPNEQE